MSEPFNFEVITPLALAFVGAPLLRLAVRGHGGQRAPPGSWLMLIVPLVSLAYWFAMAPDPRHAGASFWLLANAAVALAVYPVDSKTGCGLGVGLVCLSVSLPELLMEWRRNVGPLRPLKIVERVTNSGLRVYVPKGDSRVWNAPLPCTPYFNPELKARDPDDLSRGFVLDR